MLITRLIHYEMLNLITILEHYMITAHRITHFFFWIRGNLTSRKAHFVGPGEGVKPRLSQVLTKGARPDSNSRPAVQISNPLPSRYTSWEHRITH